MLKFADNRWDIDNLMGKVVFYNAEYEIENKPNYHSIVIGLCIGQFL
jgi:hypothetical protein